MVLRAIDGPGDEQPGGTGLNESAAKEGTGKQHRALFAALSLVMGLTFAALLAEWGLGIWFQRIQTQAMDPGLIRYHAMLGWSLSPNWAGRHAHHDYDVTYSTDANSFRNQYQPPLSLAVNRSTVAVLGDSFTFGLGVNDEETFVSVLNNGTGPRFINYAIPGKSTDQQLLLLRSLLLREAPDQVLLVVYLANDILDNTLEYPLQAEQAKPMFVLDGCRLELENTPVPVAPKPARLRSTTLGTLVLNGFDTQEGLLESTAIGRMLSTVMGGRAYDGAELRPVLERNLQPALALFAALIDEMAAEVTRHSSGLTVALLPGRDAMINTRGISHHYQDYLREAIVAGLADKGVATIDLMSAMATDPEASVRNLYFPNDGHLTPAGHRYVAGLLADHLNP